MTEPRTLQVDLGARSYPIIIGGGLLGGAFDLSSHLVGSDCLVVSNETVAPLYLKSLKKNLPDRVVHSINLKDGESGNLDGSVMPWNGS